MSPIDAVFFRFNRKGRIICQHRTDTNHHSIGTRFQPVNALEIQCAGNFYLPTFTGGDLPVSTHRDINHNTGSHEIA
jgi:hypothetical protein